MAAKHTRERARERDGMPSGRSKLANPEKKGLRSPRTAFASVLGSSPHAGTLWSQRAGHHAQSSFVPSFRGCHRAARVIGVCRSVGDGQDVGRRRAPHRHSGRRLPRGVWRRSPARVRRLRTPPCASEACASRASHQRPQKPADLPRFARLGNKKFTLTGQRPQVPTGRTRTSLLLTTTIKKRQTTVPRGARSRLRSSSSLSHELCTRAQDPRIRERNRKSKRTALASITAAISLARNPVPLALLCTPIYFALWCVKP